MTKYIKINVKLINTQINKLKDAIKNDDSVTLRFSSDMFKHDKLPHELYLTSNQYSSLEKAFSNYLSKDVKLSKSQLKNLVQQGSFLGKLLAPLMKFALPLAKNVLAPLGLSTGVSLIDGGIKKSMLGSGVNSDNKMNNNHNHIQFIISTGDVNDIIKIIELLEEHNFLINGISETVKNEVNEQKGGFLSLLLRTLGASILGNLLSGKGIYRTGYGNKIQSMNQNF